MNKLFILSLLIVGCMSSSQTTSYQLNPTTFKAWSACRDNFQETDPCLDSFNSQVAKQSFMELTYGFGYFNSSDSCTRFQQDLGRIEMFNLEINTNKYYENCFITPQILEHVSSNVCFLNKYYIPLIMKCAGF